MDNEHFVTSLKRLLNYDTDGTECTRKSANLLYKDTAIHWATTAILNPSLTFVGT